MREQQSTEKQEGAMIKTSLVDGERPPGGDPAKYREPGPTDPDPLLNPLQPDDP